MINDKIKGCLIGGAAGDALGYEIEFKTEDDIYRTYGYDGLERYELHNGVAHISDDTQMTLFTAAAILRTDNDLLNLSNNIELSYQDWYETQTKPVRTNGQYFLANNPIMGIKELYSRRAPGITCLTGLEIRRDHYGIKSYIESKINNSCGCGGVMRVAPIGFIKSHNVGRIAKEAAEAAAITHSHPLGYIPAAILASIINLCIYTDKPLVHIIHEAVEITRPIFGTADEYMRIQSRGISKALDMADSDRPVIECIHDLGEGWVGHEALNIAIYCAVKFNQDFTSAIIAAANHNGDSDSTAAICGNILGARLGFDRIPHQWKTNLELFDNIVDLADKIAIKCKQ